MPWPTTSRHARGYGREHEKQRAALLRREPLCRMCMARGRVTVAVIADHIIPLAKGGKTEESNYQPLCKSCSVEKTNKDMGKRTKRTIGSDGWPVD